ncbi:hypothetical protein ACLOJK_021133 [Asimina triloba]
MPVRAEKSMAERGEMRLENECSKDIRRETKEKRDERLQRGKIREEWRQERERERERVRERERERRLEAKDAAMAKKSKIIRDRDRDISEKVALGMAIAGTARTDDQYNIHDKGLFTAQCTLSSLYKPKKDADAEMYGGADEQLEKVLKNDRFKPDKGFLGTSERAGPRDRPVEFDKHVEEADPFGLYLFLTEVKKGGKKAMEKIGSGGTMKASAGSSMRDGYEGVGSGRT